MEIFGAGFTSPGAVAASVGQCSPTYQQEQVCGKMGKEPCKEVLVNEEEAVMTHFIIIIMHSFVRCEKFPLDNFFLPFSVTSLCLSLSSLSTHYRLLLVLLCT